MDNLFFCSFFWRAPHNLWQYSVFGCNCSEYFPGHFQQRMVAIFFPFLSPYKYIYLFTDCFVVAGRQGGRDEGNLRQFLPDHLSPGVIDRFLLFTVGIGTKMLVSIPAASHRPPSTTKNTRERVGRGDQRESGVEKGPREGGEGWIKEMGWISSRLDQ